MQQVRQGWKTVRAVPSKLSSRRLWYVSAAAGSCGGRSRRYLVRRWTHPAQGDGPLCVFETRGAALLFMYNLFNPKNLQLWRCQYVEASKQSQVWARYRDRRSLEALPARTRLATQVKLLSPG